MAENQVRVLLWCIPRTVSTAFTICMNNLDDVQVINQPYLSALILGPDNRKERKNIVQMKEAMKKTKVNLDIECEDVWESDLCSYKYVKENILEAKYSEKKVVFVKDMSSAITERFHMLPNGYRHAFLIRNPEKVFSSFKKLVNSVGDEEVMLVEGKNPTEAVAENYWFGESVKLYEHLSTTGIEPKPFVMDADDLLENPKSILYQFCSFVGIEYTDRLLTWDGSNATKHWKTSKEMLQWNKIGNWHKDAFDSKEFTKSTPPPPRSELSADVLHCIDSSLPFYRKLYELRAKIIC